MAASPDPAESQSRSQQELDEELGFIPDADAPVRYMLRTREWYLALGYDNPYRWAHFGSVPFQHLKKPLTRSRVTILTTAAPYQPDKGPQGPGAPYNAAAKFYEVYSRNSAVDHDLRISHVGIDRKHTSMKDSGTWFPLPVMRKLVQEKVVGSLAKHIHGVPTNRSQKQTLTVDGPEVVRRCLEDSVEVAFLVPNCPICHQTLSIVARMLEECGIATVVMGCAKDIVEHCGVPRLLFSDFPLGNAAGRPHDAVSQEDTLKLACKVLESAPGPRTTVQSPLRWSDSHDWKLDFSNIERVSPEEQVRLRAESDKAKEVAKEIRESVLSK